MMGKDSIDEIQSELRIGVALVKCRKCGCMKATLESLRDSFSPLQAEGSSDLLRNIEHWLKQMEPEEYACLGCKHCYPAMAISFPEIISHPVRYVTWSS